MISTGQSRCSTPRDRLALLYGIARLHINRTEMPVDRLQPIAVIDHHTVSVNAKFRRIHHLPRVGGHYRNVLRHTEIESEVHLPIHFLALVYVGPLVGELRFHLRISKLHERSFPQDFLLGLRS